MTREEAMRTLELSPLTESDLRHRFNISLDSMMSIEIGKYTFSPSEILHTCAPRYYEIELAHYINREVEDGNLVQLDDGYFLAKDYLAIELLVTSTKNRKA